MTTHLLRRNTRLLVINPNSSTEMTAGMDRAIRSMDLAPSLEITTYTAPSASPASINDALGIELSTDVVWAHLSDTGLLHDYYDGVLVACYSEHSLVPKIAANHPGLSVTGIFEASIVATLPLLDRAHNGGWGIVTTGKFWEEHLSSGFRRFLGRRTAGDGGDDGDGCFFGVFSTGLMAGDFHGHVPQDVLRDKLKEATRRLLRKGRVDCVVMGCAGMAGLEDIIRSAIAEEYDNELASTVYVMDGVKAGVGVLEQMVKSSRMFRPH